MKHLIFTPEWPGLRLSGGIGKAFQELAIGLRTKNQTVEVILISHFQPTESEINKFNESLNDDGLQGKWVSTQEYTWSQDVPALSYASLQVLLNSYSPPIEYEKVVLHYADYLGMAFYTLQARRCGALSICTVVVVHGHGPTSWTRECNHQLMSAPEQMQTEHIEEMSIRQADLVTTPSKYLASWLVDKKIVGQNTDVFFLPNLIRTSRRVSQLDTSQNLITNKQRIIFLGRHEPRKGFNLALDLVDALNESVDSKRTEIEFWGQPSFADGCSAAFLIQRAMKWQIDWLWRGGMNQRDVMMRMELEPDALFVIASPVENAPYVVLESSAVGAYMVSSERGGGPELLSDQTSCVPMTVEAIMKSINQHREGTLKRSDLKLCRSDQLDFVDRFLKRVDEVFSSKNVDAMSINENINNKPSLSVIVTTFKRPRQLFRCLTALAEQDDPDFELIVVDDFSEAGDDIWFKRSKRLVEVLGGVLIQHDTNRYLGAARNTGLHKATCDFVVFIDDDDIAMSGLVSDLKDAATNSNADVIFPFSIYQDNKDVDRRAWVDTTEFESRKVSYLPTVGPVAASPWANYFGQSTAAIRRKNIQSIGGFTELVGVGYEDFELYVQGSILGWDYVVLPKPVFLYTTVGSSMVSSTSAQRNQMRVNSQLVQQLAATRVEPRVIDEIFQVASAPSVKANSLGRAGYLFRLNSVEGSIPLDQIFNCRDVNDLLQKLDELRISLLPSTLDNSDTRSSKDLEVLNRIYLHEGSDKRINRPFTETVGQSESSLRMLNLDEMFSELVLRALGTDLKEPNNSLTEAFIQMLDSIQTGEEIDLAHRVLSSSWGNRILHIENNVVINTLIDRLVNFEHGPSKWSIALMVGIHDYETAEKALEILLAREGDNYISQYPDLASLEYSPWRHFNTFGRSENRTGFREIDQLRQILAKAGSGQWLEIRLNERLNSKVNKIAKLASQLFDRKTR